LMPCWWGGEIRKGFFGKDDGGSWCSRKHISTRESGWGGSRDGVSGLPECDEGDWIRGWLVKRW